MKIFRWGHSSISICGYKHMYYHFHTYLWLYINLIKLRKDVSLFDKCLRPLRSWKIVRFNNAEKTKLVLLENPGAFHKASEALSCILLLNLMWLAFLFEYISDCFSLYSSSESPHCTLTQHLWVQLGAHFRPDNELDACKLCICYPFCFISIFLSPFQMWFFWRVEYAKSHGISRI